MDKSGSERSYEKRNGDGAEFYAAGGVLHDRRPADQFLFAEQGVSAFVGMNPLSFLTAGVLGIPGVALLYGIQLYL